MLTKTFNKIKDLATKGFIAFVLVSLFPGTNLAATPPGTVISNIAQAIYSITGVPGFIATSNTDQFTIASNDDVADVTIEFDDTTLYAGDSTTLTLTVTNKGNNDLTNGSLVVTLPSDPGNAMKGMMAISKTANDYQVDIPDVAAGATQVLSVTTTISIDEKEGVINIPIVYRANNREFSTFTKSITIKTRTDADISTLYYDSSLAAAPVTVNTTDYDAGDGTYTAVPSPTVPLTSTLVTDAPVSLIPESEFHKGQTLFIKVNDGDQNSDSTVLDWVMITLSTSLALDAEHFKVYETGVDTGIFIAYIPTSGSATAIYDGMLNVKLNDKVLLSYADDVDGSDSKSISTLVDPFGIIFDSSTGSGVDGVTVTLIDMTTGQPATVFGDDGVSLYPATMVTGQSVTDAAGTVYTFPQGNYRFPLLVPGEYRLNVSLPAGAGFTAPSVIKTSALQALPGGPFAIDVGSRGEVFRVNPGPPLHLDLPIDPIEGALFVKKEASKTLVANGDFVQYTVSVENVTTLMNITNARIIDQLPHGFRYEAGSTTLDDAEGTDPTIAADGLGLTFALGAMAPGDIHKISYVVAVAAAKPGKATNRASALGDGAANSNVAERTVTVKDDLMRSHSILMGRVINKSSNDQGLAGIRIYLEDGTYTVTDERGMYHFEGLLPGTHVIQLDLASLPEGYKVLAINENTRSAGTPFSRFIDLQGGTMWSEDFYVAKKAPVKGEVGLLMESDADGKGYTLTLNNQAVPLSNIRLLVMLGKNEQYAAETARLDGKVFQNPEVQGSVITYRFSNFSADSEAVLKFKVFLSEKASGLSGKAALMFDTPAKKGLRTAIAISKVSGDRDNAGVSIETDGTPSADINTDSNEEKSEIAFDKLWFDKDATAQMGRLLSSGDMPDHCSVGRRRSDFQAFAAGQNLWLWPSANHLPPIPSQKIVIKHAPGDKVKLYLDGTEVSGFHFEGGLKVMTDEAEIGLSRWRGIDLVEGDNYFTAVIHNAEGLEIDRLECKVHYSSPPVSARFVEEKSTLIADGINPPVIAVRLLDKTGYPAREGIFGEFSVEEPYRPLRKIKAPVEVMPGAPKVKNEFIVEKDGIVYIKLEPTTQTGVVKVTFPLMRGAKWIKTRLTPQKRDWILVGFAEGTAGYNTLSGNIEGLSGNAAEEDFYSDGQLKFYAKGQIKGEWLLTMAYDSEKNTNKNKLFQTIDPGTFYTLYGDTSSQRYEAASSEKLYVKLERDDFYALFGDFDTNLSVTELTRYQRSLTGLKSEYFGGKYQFNLFVSESNQAYAKEAIRGQGISGPYQLTRKNIVMNSEKITIETRDRFRSEVVVSSETPSRHLDYDIDYDKGTIIFRRPVFSTDSGFNPTFIVVEYESFDDTDRSVSYGGRIALNKPTEPFKLGVTHINEGVVGGKAQMQGVDVAYDFSKETRVSAEIAKTRFEDNLSDKKGEAYLVELKHREELWDAKAYLREVGSDYGLGQLNNSEAGTRKFGVDATIRPNKGLGLKSQAYRQETLATGAVRELIALDGTLRYKKTNLNAGFTSAKDTLGTGKTQRSDLITFGADQSVLLGLLTFRVRQDMAIDEAQNSDYPARTTLGVDYKLNKDATLFAEQEWTNGKNRDTQSSRVGIKTKKSTLFTEQQISNGSGNTSQMNRIGAKASPWERGEVTTALDRVNNGTSKTDRGVLGLSQEWQINERWSVGAGYERGETFSSKAVAPINPNVPFASGGSGDFYAASVGLTYKHKGWLWMTRVENRNADTDEKNYLASSVQTEVNKDLGLLTSFTLTDSDQMNGRNNFKSDLRIGLAYRPAGGLWIVLDKLDLIHEKVAGVALPYKNHRIVNNLNANYRASRKWQLAFQYGAKLLRENINNKAYESFIDLVGAESRYDLNKEWDLGVRMSGLHSWKTDQIDYSYGLSVGHSFAKNVWMSLGYNFAGFRDDDFSKADYTSKGVYVKFRMKFDQESVKGGLAWLRR